MNPKNSNNSLNLEFMRDSLNGKTGQEYWRSLEELSQTPGFQEILEDEFPQQARPLKQEVDRRQFLLLAGASLGLAGLSGCRFLPQKKIVPYVEQPEDMVLGKPLFYASAISLSGYATGVIVTSHDGRPTKIEGNRDHPASLGASDSFTQGTILTMYDPDRSQNVQKLGDPSSWSAFLDQARQNLIESGGKGFRILSETVTSPTLADQMGRILKQFPAAKWHQYEPINRDGVHDGTKLAFGEPLNPIYHFDKAEIVVSLDADFLNATYPGNLRYAREFSNKRRLRTKDISIQGGEGAASKIEQPKNAQMNRLYVIESSYSITGAMADHRLPVKASQIEGFAGHLAKALGLSFTGAPEAASANDAVLKAMVSDLQANRGKALVIAGDQQPAGVHALAAAMNDALGAIGSTVSYTAPIEANPVNQMESLKELCADMKAGGVKILLILGGNPVYTAPPDLNFASLLKQTQSTIHLSLFDDETSELCQWHLPDTHPLEAWSDARAFDGTVSIVQPLIAPLYEGKSAHEVLSAFLSAPGETDMKALGSMQNGYEILREYWSRPVNPDRDALAPGFKNLNEKEFENAFQTVLHNGLFKDSAAPAKNLKASAAKVALSPEPAGSANKYSIAFPPDPCLYDGRFSNNGWLQELPKPISKLTWDNAAYISPGDAVKLGLAKEGHPDQANEKVIEIKVGEAVLRVPALVLPGHADGAITLTQGYGRTKAGKVGTGTGFNANLLRTSAAPWISAGAEVSLTGATYDLAHTREAHSMDAEAHTLIRVAYLDDFNKPEHLALVPNEASLTDEQKLIAEEKLSLEEKKVKGDTQPVGTHESLYWKARENEHKYEGEGAYAWGMSIDNNVCIGCNACITACQSENNISVVGKDQVRRGRDMLWLRIDTYYRGNFDNPGTFFEPVPCMHCEMAPCEPVCPVAATVHSHEGINMQVYNRCVGTKYCGNNCPYKVRRFNYYKYAAGQPEPDKMPNNYDSPVIKLSANPDVTIRGRGVMEKCTYCVQRVNATRIEAKKEGRTVKDGEIQTACQQSCPTQAIVFGNINDKESVVSQLKEQPHDFTLLADLNLRPRTTYLARVQNPNAEILAATPEVKKGA